MRRTLAAGLVCMGLIAAAPASAHPLGNFSVNHLDTVSISSSRVAVHYVLDQAEIPTFQERGLGPAAVLARKEAEVRRGVVLTVDGKPAVLGLQPGARISFPPGQGGLKLTRVEVDLSAKVSPPADVQLRDGTFPGRVGWKAVIVHAGNGTAVRSSVPATDPTGGLRGYPKDML